MKRYLAFTAILLTGFFAFSQKKTYDITTYARPVGWKEEKGDGLISYSRVDGASWGQLAIYEQTASSGDVQTDFDNAWKTLVATPRQLTTAPEKMAPDIVDGWTVQRGSGMWAFNGVTVTSVLTVYSHHTISVSVLCNAAAKPYLKDYQALIGSLKLKAPNIPATGGGGAHTPANNGIASGTSKANGGASQTNTPTNNGAVTSGTPAAGKPIKGIAGNWEFTTNETSGSMITGGYFRREYRLNVNGTYEYLTKSFSAHNPVILLGREAGTWTVKDNQLTIRPTQGNNEEWSKSASGRNTEWGKLVKTTTRKLETVTYTIELQYLSGMEKTYLRMTSRGPTVRDGRQSNDVNANHQFTYAPGTPGKPLVDLPPGKQ